MDFGMHLRGLMRDRELTGRGVARRVPCDPALISRLASGRQRPSVRIAQLLDDVLGASGALVETAERDRGAVRGVAVRWADERGVDDEVNRRELLGAMVAGPLALQLEQIRRRLDGAAGGGAAERDADEWEWVAAEYAQRVDGLPPALYLPHLLADAGEVTERVVSSSGSVRVRLTRSAAQIAALTAIGLATLGDEMTAARWWRTAARVAGESGDSDLVALVLGKHADQSILRPSERVLALADEALAAASGRSCAGAASAHAARAQVCAGMGRRADALGALADYKRVRDGLPDGNVDPVRNEWRHDDCRALAVEAWVLTKTGDARDALAAQDAYQACSSNPAGRARMELLRAEALIRAGDVDDGADHCAAVLKSLPEQWRRTRGVVRRAGSALGAVPASLGARASVRDAREVLALPAGRV
jgi:transcriptional regulator with XRE-family HTH domain